MSAHIYESLEIALHIQVPLLIGKTAVISSGLTYLRFSRLTPSNVAADPATVGQRFVDFQRFVNGLSTVCQLSVNN